MTEITKEKEQEYATFEKNREKFFILLQSGVLDLESGRIEINANNGKIQSVHIHKMTYKRDAKADTIPL